MAAGQSSTMTGTYAGQFVMEVDKHQKWSVVRLSVLGIPEHSVASLETSSHHSFNCYSSNIITSICFWRSKTFDGNEWFIKLCANDSTSFCFVTHYYFYIPHWDYVRVRQLKVSSESLFPFLSKSTMKFRAFQIFALCTAAIVLSINFYFSSTFIISSLGTQWYSWVLLTVPGFIYLMFIIYLVIVCLHALGWINSEKVINKKKLNLWKNLNFSFYLHLGYQHQCFPTTHLGDLCQKVHLQLM